MKKLVLVSFLGLAFSGCTKDSAKNSSSDGNFCSSSIINSYNEVRNSLATTGYADRKACLHTQKLLGGSSCQAVEDTTTKAPMTVSATSGVLAYCPTTESTGTPVVTGPPTQAFHGPIAVPGTRPGNKNSDKGQGVDRFGHCTPRLMRANEQLEKAITAVSDEDTAETRKALSTSCRVYERLLNGKSCKYTDAQTKEVSVLEDNLEACTE